MINWNRAKQRKQQELFHDSVSPHGYGKQKQPTSPTRGPEIKPVMIGSKPVVGMGELTQTTFDINDRSGTISEVAPPFAFGNKRKPKIEIGRYGRRHHRRHRRGHHSWD